MCKDKRRENEKWMNSVQLSPIPRGLFVLNQQMWWQDCDQFRIVPGSEYLPGMKTQTKLKGTFMRQIIKVLREL